MRRLSFTQKILVIFQTMLTLLSIAYELRYGFVKFHPDTIKGVLIVILKYGLLGLLCSPITFAYIIYNLIRTHGGYLVATLPGKIVALPLWKSLPLILLYAISAIFLVYIAFKPFLTFIDNLDYVAVIFQPALWLPKKKKYPASAGKPDKAPAGPPAGEFAKTAQGQANGQLPQTGAIENNNTKAPKRDLTAFDSLVGVDSAIEAIKDALELPLLYPEKIKEYGIIPPKGLLLCGPPGTGKTSLARAAAAYFGCYFAYVKASEFLGPYTGTSEQAVKTLFADARANRPAIIFFDEIDAVCRKRDGAHLNRASDIVLNILLAEMDGFERDSGLFIIGATNRADVLDEAVLRPGRFDTIIELKLPDLYARSRLFWLLLKGKPVAEALQTKPLAEQTEGMSPAQIESICRKAAITALKREISAGADANNTKGLRMADILSAIEDERQASERRG